MMRWTFWSLASALVSAEKPVNVSKPKSATINPGRAKLPLCPNPSVSERSDADAVADDARLDAEKFTAALERCLTGK